MICGELSIPITVSLGIAVLDAERAEVDQLLKRADDALLRAKRAGRNRAVTAGG